jgi:lysine biosynthesis protein LysW
VTVAYCPDCGRRIELGRKPWVGQPAFCERCHADLEVVQTNPLALDWSDNLLDENWEKDWQFESSPA